jgi:hypothetical protein
MDTSNAILVFPCCLYRCILFDESRNVSVYDTQTACSAEQRRNNSSSAADGTAFLSRNGLVREFQADAITC